MTPWANNNSSNNNYCRCCPPKAPSCWRGTGILQNNLSWTVFTGAQLGPKALAPQLGLGAQALAVGGEGFLGTQGSEWLGDSWALGSMERPRGESDHRALAPTFPPLPTSFTPLPPTCLTSSAPSTLGAARSAGILAAQHPALIGGMDLLAFSPMFFNARWPWSPLLTTAPCCLTFLPKTPRSKALACGGCVSMPSGVMPLRSRSLKMPFNRQRPLNHPSACQWPQEQPQQ
jgi:hypothetical protein